MERIKSNTFFLIVLFNALCMQPVYAADIEAYACVVDVDQNSVFKPEFMVSVANYHYANNALIIEDGQAVVGFFEKRTSMYDFVYSIDVMKGAKRFVVYHKAFDGMFHLLKLQRYTAEPLPARHMKCTAEHLREK